MWHQGFILLLFALWLAVVWPQSSSTAVLSPMKVPLNSSTNDSIPLWKSFQKINLTYRYNHRNFCNSDGVVCYQSTWFVKELDLIGFGIKHIPANSFVGFNSLSCLNLSNNNITCINQEAFAGLETLVALQLGNVTNTEGCLEKLNLSYLKRLNLFGLGSNALDTIPTALLCSVSLSLQGLSIDFNKITHIGRNSLSCLTKMVGLGLSHNQITTIESGAFDTMPFLGDLYLNNNLFGDNLPFVLFSNNHAMSRLWMTHVGMTVLPPGLFLPCKNLTDLRFDVKVLRSDDFPSMNYLQSLRLNKNSITSLPEGVFDNMPNLKLLSLGYNKLTSFGIPKNVFNRLRSLQYLYLDGNHLSVFPRSIFNLTSLTILHMNGNQLVDFPGELVCQLSLLETLNVGDNQISSTLPSNFFNCLPHLKQLYLHNNKFFGPFPPIGKNVNLTGIIIHSNEFFGRLPQNLNSLSALKFLTLSENRFSCAFPDIAIDTNAKVSISVGNTFEGPLKQSYNETSSSFLISSEFPTEWQVPVLWTGGSIVVFVVVLVLFSDRDLWRCSLELWKQSVSKGLHNFQCFGLACLTSLALLAIIGLLPVYWNFGDFYECGRVLSKLSAAYINGDYAGWISSVQFVIYGAITLFFIISYLYQDRQQECNEIPLSGDEYTRDVGWFKSMFSITVVIITTILSAIPMALYFFAGNLPPDNVVTNGYLPHVQLETVVIAVLYPLILTSRRIIIPRVCMWSSNFIYPNDPRRACRVGVRRMLIVLILQSTLFPILLIFFWDESCLGYFMVSWTECHNNHFLARECVTNPYWDAWCSGISCNADPCNLCTDLCPWTVYLSPESVCSQSFRWGFCTRRIVGVWGVVVFQKFIYNAFLSTSILLLTTSRRLSGLLTTVAKYVPFTISPKDDVKSWAVRDAVLLSDLETAIVWGFFAPLVLPAAVLSWGITTLSMAYLRVKWNNSNLFMISPVYSYSLMAPFILFCFGSFMFLESVLSGGFLVFSASGVGICVIVTLAIFLHWSRRRKLYKRNTDSVKMYNDFSASDAVDNVSDSCDEPEANGINHEDSTVAENLLKPLHHPRRNSSVVDK